MSMHKAVMACLVGLALGASGAVFAQQDRNRSDRDKSAAAKKPDWRAGGDWQKDFAAADRNNDGALSREELDRMKDDERFKGLRENFSGMDRNNDGKVTKDERNAWHRSWDEDFARADTNNDGAVSREELDRYKEDDRFTGIREHFARMDANNDGKVSKDERDRFLQARERREDRREAKSERRDDRRDARREGGAATGGTR